MADGQMNIRATLDLSELERKAARYGQAVRQMGVVTDEQGQVMSTAWTRMEQAAGAYLTLDIVKRIAQTRGEFQSLNVAFTTMLGDGAKAQRLMAESVELAAHTPFTLQDVASGAKQLLAYGFAAEEITDTLRRLGDVASALGLPMERLTYLYGTTATQGRLYARDMIQFTTSGVPVLQELAKMYGKTTEEINNMVTAGKIGFDDVKKVFEGMTNEGGRFYNLMEETSKTITGKISNLGDAIEEMFNGIGQANEGIINGAIDGAKYLVENYEKVGKILTELVAAYGVYKTSLITIAAVQKLSAEARTTAEIQGYEAILSEEQKVKLSKLDLAKTSAEYAAAVRAEVMANVASAEQQAQAAQISLNIQREEIKALAAKKAATQEQLVVSQALVAQRKAELDTAILSGNQRKIDSAQKKYDTAATEQNTIAEIKNAQTKEFTAKKIAVKAAAARVNALSTAAETAKIQANTIATQANATAHNFLNVAMGKVSKIASKLGTLIASNVWTIAAAAVAALAYGIYKLVTYETDAEKATKRLAETSREYQKSIAVERVEIDLLFGRLNAATKGTKEYEAAKSAIQKKYGNYLDGLRAEIKSLEDVEGAYKAITEAALESARARMAEKATTEATEAYGEIESENLKKIGDSFRKEFGDLKGEELFQNLRESIIKGLEISPEVQEAIKKFNREVTTAIGGGGVASNQIISYSYNDVEGAIKKIREGRKILEDEEEKIRSIYGLILKPKEGGTSEETPIKTFSEQLKEAKKNVEVLENQLSDLRSGKTTSNDYNKDISDTLSQLSDARKVVENLTGITQKANEKRVNDLEKINEELLSLQKQNQQAQIDLMQEGTEKELAQIRFDYQEKIAEIKKLADKWASEQGGTLTSEQTVQISTAYSSAKQERDNSTTEAYQKGLNELLQKYQDYDAKRREIEEKFAKDMQTLESRKTPVNAKQITGAQEELKYQREQALAEIANEFASRSEEFESWMNEIASFSLDKLYETLRAAQAELGKLQVAGKGGKQLAEAQAKVDAIKKEISKKKKDESEGPDNRSIKDWQELYKTLLKVDRQFQEIGDSVGGLAGEIISTAGSIATSTMSMINSIINFSNTSVDTTVITSKVAATAIKTVEKASVILTIISAALEIATKIASLFTGKSKNERDTERLQATTSKLAETNEIINRLIEKRIELINSANAAERKGIEESAQDIIDIQKKRMEQSFQNLLGTELLGKKGKNNDLDVEDLGIRNIDQLKEFLSSKRLLDLEANGYSLTNKDQWEQIIKNWDELNEKAKELENAVKEANTGLTFEDAKDGLDDLLLSADTTFEDISGNFEEYMRNSVLKMVKSRYLNDAMQKWYDNFAERVSDGDLSEEDVNKLQSEYESMYENAQSRIDQMLAAARLSLEGGEEQTPNAQTGSISETITEQTASEMTGIWRGQYDTLKGIYTVNSSFYESYKSTMAICNGILNQIADNTGRTAENTTVLSGINDTLSRMDGRLKTLESNSNKKYI